MFFCRYNVVYVFLVNILFHSVGIGFMHELRVPPILVTLCIGVCSSISCRSHFSLHTFNTCLSSRYFCRFFFRFLYEFGNFISIFYIQIRFNCEGAKKSFEEISFPFAFARLSCFVVCFFISFFVCLLTFTLTLPLSLLALLYDVMWFWVCERVRGECTILSTEARERFFLLLQMVIYKMYQIKSTINQ